ncbi:kinase-like domain-containing protein [Gilbertella persicaria]|uniref:kinase-like domain-containing protein n=1 Tax=Gilbertella persicaria TaxID=101096 RepID=UPI00221FA65C|nr:kinase-like domain-containing protein [Gilbertella persicaria]KAI8075865.1 kinase-like domain-containing protein [Gilbertella persicaria]
MNNSPTSSKINLHTKRSLSMSSEASGLHVRLPTLHHSEREPAPYSPISQNNMCPSESNWANKYEDFDIGKPIGYGSSAVVYEAVYKPLKKRVAVKMIDLDMFERNQIDELRRETALMALSKHPNVLRVYGSFVNGSKLYIVTPYLSAGSCLDIMKTSFPDGLDEISIATILKQALEGLVYLHKNGHIHRDVKAGNLLMDQYGTVLLADFGVSSSLTENGDMRKTFVGTPCWMAPEVMEQAGYDYKADIWSFGITSLELATGHAPFAKYPPMKVLMMTLSNAPPTLDREATKHKYSKLFKDMIDLCLQKDPSKRPSAEKLLAHPFFKQAKKKDHLVKSILSHVLPLDQRPHKKVPQKHISFEATEQWDFDTQDNDPPVVIDKSETPILSSAPLERSRSVVQFEECPKPIHKSSSPVETEPIKKHISFGDAVIRELPSVNRPGIMSPLVESPPHHDDYLPTTTPKKSRFVIEGTQPSPASDSPASNVSAEAINVHSGGVGLGISTTPVNNTHALPPPPPPPLSSAAANIQSNDNTLQEGEFKKGRFSVNQTHTTTTRPTTPAPVEEHIMVSTPVEFKPTPMYRNASQDSFQEQRRSRFEIKHTAPNTPIEPLMMQGLPLTRESSNASSIALSRDGSVSNSKISRFSIEKPEGSEVSLSAVSPECRKKGRFELTGGSTNEPSGFHSDSPQSTVAPSPAISPSNSLSRGQAHRILDSSMPHLVYSHMESLIKQNEIQKSMLQDLLTTLPFMYHPPATRSRTASDSKKPPSVITTQLDESYQR